MTHQPWRRNDRAMMRMVGVRWWNLPTWYRLEWNLLDTVEEVRHCLHESRRPNTNAVRGIADWKYEICNECGVGIATRRTPILLQTITLPEEL